MRVVNGHLHADLLLKPDVAERPSWEQRDVVIVVVQSIHSSNDVYLDGGDQAQYREHTD